MLNVSLDLTDGVVFAVTVLLCLVVLNSRNLTLNRRATKDLRQRHATHARPAPRLGGAAIFTSFLLTTLFFDGYFGGRHAKVIVAMFPMIAVTLWEDMVRPTPPRARLLGVVATALLTVGSLQVWLTSVDVLYLDLLMPGVTGILLTVLLLTVTVNGFNMIDGLNGLCAGTALAALLALAYISGSVGFEFMVHISLALSAAVAGFLIFNFPWGRIFLGDTGAYVLGFLVTLSGVRICERFPAVSPWAVFLILAYPLGEVLITFFRRLLAGLSPFEPDNMHLHHLVLVGLRGIPALKGLPAWHNPVATLLVLPAAVGPMIFAAAYFDQPRTLQLGALAYAAAMITLYASVRLVLRGAQKTSKAMS